MSEKLTIFLSRFTTAENTAMVIRLFKFGSIGCLGFIWDSATVYGLRPFTGLTAATLIAYFVAATLNWLLNRLWTFREVESFDHPLRQWARFLVANSLGFLLNRSTVYTLFYFFPLCRDYPVIALAAGSLAGLIANFNLSEKIVFRKTISSAPSPDQTSNVQSEPEKTSPTKDAA